MPPGPGLNGSQIFQAAGDISPGLRFDDIDIICNRNSLRSLVLICSANNSPSFRPNLQLAHDTLLIESYNPRPFADIGFGRVFEDNCKSYFAESEEGISASKSLRSVLIAILVVTLIEQLGIAETGTKIKFDDEELDDECNVATEYSKMLAAVIQMGGKKAHMQSE